ncbi:MAG: hypothetical protein EHM42_10380 [Planctomycetaceae bacterium]|nr:MAG: hypothetical protein EHM42_10380 [Planctomycetaceae bacterium]
MSRVRFIEQLASDGRVIVAPPGEDATDPSAIDAALTALDQLARTDLPAGLPEFDLPAARHGQELLYRACQFLAFRDLDPELIDQALPVVAESATAARHLSIDVVLRFLPDVLRLARAASPDDPLVTRLRLLARLWPLSSVGIPDLGPVDSKALHADPAVWQVYVERIVARGDASRAAHPLVRQTLCDWAGGHPELLRGLTEVA